MTTGMRCCSRTTRTWKPTVTSTPIPTSTNGQALGRYQITAFAPAYSKDDYESTAWTLNGKIADLLSMVYTGSYHGPPH